MMKVTTRWEGDVVATLNVINMYNGVAQIHQDVYRWNKSIYLQMLADFEDLKKLLKTAGIKKLVTGSKDLDNKKIPKYWKMMGFLKPSIRTFGPETILYAEMEI